MRNLFLYLWLLIPLFACQSGDILIESAAAKRGSKGNIEKIVTINPTYKFVDKREGQRKSHTLAISAQRQQEFFQALKDNADKVGIPIELFDPLNSNASDLSFFNELLPLKQSIMQANSQQRPELAYKGSSGRPNSRSEYFFIEDGIKIESSNSYLAEKYGTPYFAVHGLVSFTNRGKDASAVAASFVPKSLQQLASDKPSKESLYYCIIADVVKSELVYREIRYFRNGTYDKAIKSMILDSFKQIKKL